jgi:uncharacterized membrane protein YjgN (DUF898 family)
MLDRTERGPALLAPERPGPREQSMHQYPHVDAAPLAAPGAGLAPPQPHPLAVQFTGNAAEYFRIWVVNLLLTIVTLGIYSAWAKVRNKQYFYRHTLLDGSSFEYLADPIRILKGRIVVALVIAALVGAQYYSLPVYIALLVALLLIAPWATVKALAFNARNSAYRNVRFAFSGKTGEAFALYIGMTFFYVVTCGFGYPFAQWRLTQFVATNHGYGDQRFAWDSGIGAYYKAYLILIGLSLPGYLLLVVMIGGVAMVGEGTEAGNLVLALGMLGFYAYLLIPAAFARALMANLFYGGLYIGPHRLRCYQRGTELLKLYLTNALALLLSLGLLAPWARVRLARYRASRMTLYAFGSLSATAPAPRREPSALGDAATDLGDFGIDLGL